MRTTWEHDPNHRPNYAKIKRKLSQGLQRLSAIISAKNNQKEQPTPLITDSKSRPSQASSTIMTPFEIDDSGIYRNFNRQTMNYYKNDC